MLKKTLTALVAGLLTAVSLTAQAADPETKVIAKGLDNPTGLAVQPGTGHVFVASHAGIHRLDPASGRLTAEVAGYPDPTDIYGKGPKYNIGPLGLAFLDQNHLVVGDGSRVDGEELVRIYKVGNEPAAAPQKEADAVHTLGPIAPQEKSPKGEGNFYGVAANANWIVVTCNGDDTKGWIARSKVTNGKPGPLELAIATKEATGVDAPGPVIFGGREGRALIVGQIGEVNQAGDSLLTMYNAEDGQLTRKLTTGLSDICGLARSPKTRSLYATDFSWVDAKAGGLFKLEVDFRNRESTEAKATKVLSLDKPSAVVFDANGDCYVAVFGTAAEGSTESVGQIIKVSGL